MRKTKYPESLKRTVGELFSLRNSSGKRLYTAKRIASELGIDLEVTFYLAYEGRKLLGTLAPKKAFKTRSSKGYHNMRGKPLFTAMITPQTSATEPTLEQVSDFVEENIHTAKEDSFEKLTRADLVSVVLITAIVCFVIASYVINNLINTLV